MSGPSIYDMSDSEYALAAEDQREELFPHDLEPDSRDEQGTKQ